MAKAGNPMMQFLPLMVIMFAVMYFLIIRPQKQKEKKRQEMITNVRKQDRSSNRRRCAWRCRISKGKRSYCSS